MRQAAAAAAAAREGAGGGARSYALRLIDYEFACVNPRAFDVANFFLECAFVEETEEWNWGRVPPRSQKRAFAAAYAAAWQAQRTGREGAAPLEADALLREWESGWNLAAHVWNVLWALTMAHKRGPVVAADAGGGAQSSVDTFDYVGYAVGRWARYAWEKRAMSAGLWAGAGVSA